MNELQRQVYLDTLGVQAVYPRRMVPGAKSSPVYDLPLAESPQELSHEALQETRQEPGLESRREPSKETRPETRQEPGLEPRRESRREPSKETRRESPQESRQESPESETRRAAEAAAAHQDGAALVSKPGEPAGTVQQTATGSDRVAATAPAAEPAPDPLRFQLRYYPINRRLAVIDELPHQQGGAVAPAAIGLLRNILHALNVDVTDCAFNSESFQWPLPGAPALNIDPGQAAVQAFKGFIAGRRQQDGFENLLVFAGQIDDLLLGTAGGVNERDYQPAGTDYHLTVTGSLQSMLSYPLLKRDVWEHLQPLRRRLAA